MSYKYYKGLTTSSIYRTKNIKFSDGTPTLSVQRWNWDFENWNGHIHNHKLTREAIKEGLSIVEITKEEAYESIKS